jgi:hypothetical protein
MEEVHHMLSVKPTRTSASSGSTMSSTQHLNTTAVTASKVEQICPVASLMRVMLSGALTLAKPPSRPWRRLGSRWLLASYCLGKTWMKSNYTQTTMVLSMELRTVENLTSA